MDPMKPRNRAYARLPQTSWYRVRNATATDTAVIRIYDEIIDTDQFVRDLGDITAPRIRVDISSPGGDVFAGLSVYNQLRAHPAHVTTQVDGVAASIASVIVQAGDRRIMLTGSQAMIHRAWGLALGDADEMRTFGALLDKQDAIIAEVYASRSGRPASRFRDLMAKETWFDARQAVAAGLADEVLDPARKTTNSIDGTAEYARFIATSHGIPTNR